MTAGRGDRGPAGGRGDTELPRAVGPLGSFFEHDGTVLKPTSRGYQLGADANALVVVNRVAFVEKGTDDLDRKGTQAILRWAVVRGLGQEPALLGKVAARRQAAVSALRKQGYTVWRLLARPQWRMAVGIGNRANAHEIGLSLHGSYGWPVIPGSSLKGLAAAQAGLEGATDDRLRAVFGWPRPRAGTVPSPGPDEADEPAGDDAGTAATAKTPAPAGTAARGGVRFLDAYPAGTPAQVLADVLTPHVKPYYDAKDKTGKPPAEYHNPVPVDFLAVAGVFAVDLAGVFAVDLAGRDPAAVKAAGTWLARAGDELGIGAKTAAGYGYLTIEDAESGEPVA